MKKNKTKQYILHSIYHHIKNIHIIDINKKKKRRRSTITKITKNINNNIHHIDHNIYSMKHNQNHHQYLYYIQNHNSVKIHLMIYLIYLKSINYQMMKMIFL